MAIAAALPDKTKNRLDDMIVGAAGMLLSTHPPTESRDRGIEKLADYL